MKVGEYLAPEIRVFIEAVQRKRATSVALRIML
jgi:hypothetical protein